MMTENLIITPPPPPPPAPPTPSVPPPPPPYAPTRHVPSTGIAPDVKRGQSIAALVLGCCSPIFYFTVIVPLLAIIFAGLAMSAQRKAGQKVNGMATAGLALGIVFLPLGLLFVLFAASA